MTKYEEERNAIRRRKLLLWGGAGATMAAITAGVVTGAILWGIAAGLTIPFILIILLDGSAIGWSIFSLATTKQRSVTRKCLATLLIVSVIGMTIWSAVLASAIFPVIGIAVIAVGLALGLILGIPILQEAISRWANKVEIPDYEPDNEEKPDELNKIEVSDPKLSTEEKPNEKGNPDTQINGTNEEKGGAEGQGTSVSDAVPQL